jgi:hypothetical protein
VSETFGEFELLGDPAAETRLLTHPAGFRAGIPGHPVAHPGSELAPVSQIRLVMADEPVEVTYRMDRVTNQLEMEALAVALAGAYAQTRAIEMPHIRPSRNEELCQNAEAGARAIYNLPGDDTAMEWLSVLAQSVTQTEVDVLYQVVKFRRDDLNSIQFASLRTAMVGAQAWSDDPFTNLEVWPPSRFVVPSVALTFVDDAWAEAQTKASEIGEVDQRDVDEVTKLLIGFATTDQHPRTDVPKFMLDIIAERIAQNLDTVVSVVLLRNLYDVAIFHDLRGWCWQSLWALGNRVRLRAG